MSDKNKLIHIDFCKRIGLFAGISGVLTILAFGVMMTKGFNYGIDFKGGFELQVKFPSEVKIETLRNEIGQIGFEKAIVQNFGGEGNREFLVRLDIPQATTEKQTNEILKITSEKIQGGLKAKWPETEVRRVDYVGPQVGQQLKKNSILAMFYSLLVILIYVGLRFDYKFAPGAVICLFHDVIFTLGVFALLGKEINVQILAAMLTIVGYSMNDTIIIYDRIREYMAKLKGHTIEEVINESISHTLGRTFLTSFTTFMSSMALYLFTDGAISDFGLAMAIGVGVGSYSSIYVASPLIVLLDKYRKTDSYSPSLKRT